MKNINLIFCHAFYFTISMMSTSRVTWPYVSAICRRFIQLTWKSDNHQDKLTPVIFCGGDSKILVWFSKEKYRLPSFPFPLLGSCHFKLGDIFFGHLRDFREDDEFLTQGSEIQDLHSKKTRILEICFCALFYLTFFIFVKNRILL